MTSRTVCNARFTGQEADPEQAREVGKAKLLRRLKVMPDGCWLYQGPLYWNGYGGMSFMGKNWRVHRLAFHLWNGDIPKGHDICHTCDVRHCCNPAHLWSGPRQLNNRDTTDKLRNKNSQKTHCPKGHPYAEFGRIYSKGYKGWRSCSKCQLERSRERHRRNREKINERRRARRSVLTQGVNDGV